MPGPQVQGGNTMSAAACGKHGSPQARDSLNYSCVGVNGLGSGGAEEIKERAYHIA